MIIKPIEHFSKVNWFVEIENGRICSELIMIANCLGFPTGIGAKWIDTVFFFGNGIGRMHCSGKRTKALINKKLVFPF
jgi:hypothetical protein